LIEQGAGEISEDKIRRKEMLRAAGARWFPLTVFFLPDLTGSL